MLQKKTLARQYVLPDGIIASASLKYSNQKTKTKKKSWDQVAPLYVTPDL